MANKYEDFERFLKANFNNDWLRFTSSEAKEDVKQTILANHQKGFNIYKRLNEEGLLKNDYVSPELLSGQITLEEYRQLAFEYNYQNIVYQDGVMVAIRMQYAENLPNMVYTEDPVTQIYFKASHAKEIGLKDETYERYVQGYADSYKALAKAEKLGIPEEQATYIIEKSNSIDSVMQLFEAQKRIDKAKTPEDKQTAKEQYDILHKESQEALEKHGKDVLDLMDKAIEIKKAENTNDKPKDSRDDEYSYSIDDEHEAKYGIKYEDDETYKLPNSIPQRTSKPETFALSEPIDFTETTPREKHSTSRSFNSVFASYIEIAEDVSSMGIAQALAQNYSLEQLREFHQYTAETIHQNIHNRALDEIKRVRALTQNKLSTSLSTEQPTQQTTSKRRTSSPYSFLRDNEVGI